MPDLEDARKALLEFRDAREWKQFHNPKDLAAALSIEASELLEVFLWKEAAEAEEARVREEPADVLAYSILLADKTGFHADVETGTVDDIILANFRRAHGRGVGESEVRSWQQSLMHMNLVLHDPEIPEDTGVSVELQIPQTAKRAE